MIWKVVRSVKNKPSFFEYDDLFQMGFLGLIKSIENYKENKGPFIPYATKIIKFAIQDEIRDASPISRHESRKIKGDLQAAIGDKENEYKNECIKNESILFGDPFLLCILHDPDE